MLETLRNAFKIKDIRKRIIFTFLMLVVIRIGSQLPIPGVDSEVFANWFASQTADGMGFFDAVTGGSFLNLSIFALNITPYITSSIIMQLLTIAIPKLEEMQRDGEDGRKKIAEITRYLTVALALIEAIAMAIGFSRGGYLEQSDSTAVYVMNIIMVIFTLTAGSAVLMWIGERITEKGVGNGISIVLTINIISSITSGWSKKNSGSVFQENSGKKTGWRSVNTYSSESQYQWCYPSHLCSVFITDTSHYCEFTWQGKWNRYWK